MTKHNTMNTREYHTLVVRDDNKSPWEIHFGDYDMEMVRQERFDITQHQYKFSNTKIVTTGNLQRDINAAIKELNS